MGGSPIGAAEVIVAASAGEAIEAFGDGAGVTVVAGGTIVMPEITHGRRAAERVVLIGSAGHRRASRATAAAPSSAPARRSPSCPTPLEPLGTCAAARRRHRDPRAGDDRRQPVRAARASRARAATCRPRCSCSTRRSARPGAGGERTEPGRGLPRRRTAGRLVLDISVAEPEAGATATVRRPHAHAYTVMRVCAARVGGEVRIAVSGAGPRAVRLRAAEAAFAGGADPAAAAERALDDVTPSTTRSRPAGTAPRCCRSSSAAR